MTELLPLIRKVANDHDHTVTVWPEGAKAALEVGTDEAYIRIEFTDPNALRALAGHLAAIADDVQRYQQGAG